MYHIRVGVMSSWDVENSEMKVQGGLRTGVSLEPTKQCAVRILRAQPQKGGKKKVKDSPKDCSTALGNCTS